MRRPCEVRLDTWLPLRAPGLRDTRPRPRGAAPLAWLLCLQPEPDATSGFDAGIRQNNFPVSPTGRSMSRRIRPDALPALDTGPHLCAGRRRRLRRGFSESRGAGDCPRQNRVHPLSKLAIVCVGQHEGLGSDAVEEVPEFLGLRWINLACVNITRALKDRDIRSVLLRFVDLLDCAGRGFARIRAEPMPEDRDN